ncbi:hypothetical protein ACRALDRAFT_1061467, partial [Sodiomyces alcalophilus JCM 7366]|uniref:uncharacterized protein n=1 Tax=Sodiomyces alcalophilus JCM 7366 TaxID=591952 RepID=UPI0039B36981
MDDTHPRRDVVRELPRRRQPVPSTGEQKVLPRWQNLVISGMDDEEGRLAKNLDDLGGARRYADNANAGQTRPADYGLRAPVLMPAKRPPVDRASSLTTPFGGLRRDGVPTKVFVPNAPNQAPAPAQAKSLPRARSSAPVKQREPSAVRSSSDTAGRVPPHLRGKSSTEKQKDAQVAVHPRASPSSSLPAQDPTHRKSSGICFQENCDLTSPDNSQFVARVSLVILQEYDGTARPGFLVRSIDGQPQYSHHIAACDLPKRTASHCHIRFWTSPTSRLVTYVLRFESEKTARDFVQTIDALLAVLKIDMKLRQENYAVTNCHRHQAATSDKTLPHDISPEEVQDVKRKVAEGICRVADIQAVIMRTVFDAWSGTGEFIKRFIRQLDEAERDKGDDGNEKTVPTRIQYSRTQLQEVRPRARLPPVSAWRYTETLLTSSFLEEARVAEERAARATPNTDEPQRPKLKKGLADSK